MVDDRPSVHDVLMSIAAAWAMRSTCARLPVGCVIARSGRTLSSGYNGAPPGMEHCRCEPGTVNPADPCVVSVHAEANAIAFAARHGISIHNAVLYTTSSPCVDCAKLILSAGIERVIYGEKFFDTRGFELLHNGRVQFLSIDDANELMVP